MKQINKDIQSNEFKQIYLLYGTERYLKRQFLKKMTEAICPEGDEMNITRYSGKGIDPEEVAAEANQLPFFTEHRVVIVEESGWFKKSPKEVPDMLAALPEYAYLIFVEEEADKRTAAYKAVTKLGYAAELNLPKGKELTAFIKGRAKAEGKDMDNESIEYLEAYAAKTLDMLDMELEKLFAYCIDKPTITLADTTAVCSNLAEDRIFDMVDAIGYRNTERAIELYHDLLELKEDDHRILALLVYHINALLKMYELCEQGRPSEEIAKCAGVPPFKVAKSKGQLKNFTYRQLLSMLHACQETLFAMHDGRMDGTIGIELLIVEFSEGLTDAG